MSNPSLRKAALLALVILVVFFSFWEYHLRSLNNGLSYDDGPELWTQKRSEVYLPSDKATVLIGSSRHKYDIDINTWQSITGERAIQLAFEGTSPMPALNDLANDSLFKGKLVIDITEGLVFNTSPYNMQRLTKALAYRRKITPAQRFSFEVNHLLESQLSFLDRDFYSLSAMINRSGIIPPRAGVMEEPLFPIEFGRVSFDRQDLMTDQFVKDTTLQNKVKGIWNFFSKMAMKEPPMSQQTTDSILMVIKTDVDKIRARGGQVLFVRSPSSGPYWGGEQHVFPREKLWGRILSMTGSPGIHFADYPSLANFQCVEFSHLSPADAVLYTKNLLAVMEQQKVWAGSGKLASK
ncbi:MAG: hypothetical protein V4450_05690 [Bacteroidota bacterium]